MNEVLDITQLFNEISRLRAANEKLAEAAKKMPRWTPKGGGASTMHTYQIAAADVWALDAALREHAK